MEIRYNDLKEDGWNISTTPENLAATFPDIDPRVNRLFLNAEDIKMWRLYMHEPYPYWVKGRCALLGDAAHPMMPDQSQGACMAIEDVSQTLNTLGRTLLICSRREHLASSSALHILICPQRRSCSYMRMRGSREQQESRMQASKPGRILASGSVGRVALTDRGS
jgi:hypothetical protein